MPFELKDLAKQELACQNYASSTVDQFDDALIDVNTCVALQSHFKLCKAIESEGETAQIGSILLEDHYILIAGFTC